MSGLKKPSRRRMGGSTTWYVGLRRGMCGRSKLCPILNAAAANSLTMLGLHVGLYPVNIDIIKVKQYVLMFQCHICFCYSDRFIFLKPQSCHYLSMVARPHNALFNYFCVKLNLDS
jgi:hypothetical protein